MQVSTPSVRADLVTVKMVSVKQRRDCSKRRKRLIFLEVTSSLFSSQKWTNVKVRLDTAINREDFVSWWMWFNGSSTKAQCHFLTNAILLPSYVYNMHQDTKSARLIAVCKHSFKQNKSPTNIVRRPVQISCLNAFEDPEPRYWWVFLNLAGNSWGKWGLFWTDSAA